LYHILNDHLIELEQQGMEDWRVRKTIKEEKAVADAEIEEYQQRQWKAYETNNQEHRTPMRPGNAWLPFFYLPGMVTQGQNMVGVALRPFNDKRYNQDLEALCEQVNAAMPHLPAGRRLQFSIQVKAGGEAF
jgi:hypothetical protein